jgi:hypothetical protein
MRAHQSKNTLKIKLKVEDLEYIDELDNKINIEKAGLM